MKNNCEKWKDQLREAALRGAITREHAEHLQACAHCAAELRDLEARKARLDTLLPMLVQGAQPSADFRARVLAAVPATNEKKHAQPWRFWALAGASATVIAVLVIAVTWHGQPARPVSKDELAVAQRLVEWRAPSDTLLATPGREILRTTPKLGESYLSVPVKEVEEE